MTVCDWAGCGRPAVVRVGFTLRAPAPHDDAAPSSAILGVVVCATCAESLTVADVISDRAWEVILTAYAQAERLPPDRIRTTLDFLPLGSPEEQAALRLYEKLR